MPAKYPQRYIDDCIKLYGAGLTCKDVARKMGVDQYWVSRTLKCNGIAVKRPGKLQGTPIPSNFVTLYHQGKSVWALAQHFSVSRSVIARWLRKLGLAPRSQRQAQSLRVAGMSRAQIEHQTRAAHAAARGRKHTIEEKIKRAQTVMRKQLHISEHERILRSMLHARGIEAVPQFAIGPYNCDLAAVPIAVEIFGGQWHWSGRHILRTPERFRYILDAGWNLLVIRIGQGDPLNGNTADYVAAYVEKLRRNPPVPCQYRVVRSYGQLIAAGSADDDEISIIPALTSGRDPATGRYKGVPREA